MGVWIKHFFCVLEISDYIYIYFLGARNGCFNKKILKTFKGYVWKKMIRII